MKSILIQLVLFFFLSVQVAGQIGFRNVEIQVPNATTTMQAVEIGDVSNDGLNDIVTGSVYYGNLYTVQYVVVYNQKSDGTLDVPFTLKYTQTNQTLYDIEIADVNKDQLNDIVLGMGSSIGIYYQLPSGGFSVLKTLDGVNASHGIKTGDLNDDGLLDLLGFQNGSYKIFYQTQAGEFNLTTIPVKPTNNTQIQVGDLNGDGLTDIANTCGSGIEILYQKKGFGITQLDSLFITNLNTDSYMTSLYGFTVADINNDGRDDIATAYGGNTGRMKLFYQTADGKIDTLNAKSYAAYDIPKPIRIADLNCDGDNEIIIGNHAWDRISIYNKHNLADYGSYTLYPSLYYFTPFSLAVGDINGDHLPDILDVDQGAKISILYNQSKPLSFESYERMVVNLQINRDTTTRNTVQYTAIADTATCKRNNYLKTQILQRWNNEHYSGDSVVIRHAIMCAAFTDTIKTAFSFTKNLIISSDTVRTIENRDTLYMEVGNTSFSSEPTSAYASISSNVCWKININQDWVKSYVYWDDFGDSEGIINSFVHFSIATNPTLHARKATVTIIGDGVPAYSFIIEQEGANPDVFISASSMILNEEVFNTAHLLVWSNVNWEVTVDADWLTVDKKQGVPGNNTFEVLTIQAIPNTSDTEKKAVITLTGDSNLVKKVSVRQLKYGYNALKNPIVAEIRMYPNPVKDLLTIETDASIVDSHIQISDLRGISIFESNPTAHLTEVDFSQFPKGIYLLKMEMGASIVVRKIIKQ